MEGVVLNRIKPYAGSIYGLPTNKNHANFLWNEPDCFVLFSAAKVGNYMSCHYKNDGASNDQINRAINDFCEFVFEKCDWCKGILAKVDLEKVARRIIKLGFYVDLLHNGNYYMIRER